MIVRGRSAYGESSERRPFLAPKRKEGAEPINMLSFSKAEERQGDERILLLAASKLEHRLANTGILAQQDPCQKSTELKV